MTLPDILVPELDLEAAYTRKHLERVPMDNLEFKPHEKSMPLGSLATFIAVLPTWGSLALTTDSFDVAPNGVPIPQQELVTSQRELLEMFDKNIADVRAALVSASDDRLQEPWSLVAAGNTVFTQPRYLVYRTMFLNHLVHHRAQLGVFLRLNGIAVPAVYNDSADEQGGMFVEAQFSAASAGAR
jgi:uncharacterized damage-inducible protein DinB